MTRIVFLTALTALVGCKKDECDDTAAGACDTGAEEVEEEEEEEEEEEGATDSCQFGGDICIETTNADPAGWCATEGGTANGAPCADGASNTCDIPGGQTGTYADAATAYYYNDFDGSTACSDVGGTYN